MPRRTGRPRKPGRPKGFVNTLTAYSYQTDMLARNREIKQLNQEEGLSPTELAERFGVSRQLVRKILLGYYDETAERKAKHEEQRGEQ